MNEEVQTQTDEATGQPTAETNQDFAAENQAQKNFTQEELDKIVKDRLDRERKKFQKQYEDVDVEKYRQLVEAEEQQQLEEQKRRGEFEKVLEETVSKKNSTIEQLQAELHAIKVDGNLLNAASAKRAINPQQVVALLKGQVRLGPGGDAEVVDGEGNVRYTENGSAMTVDEFVDEWLQQNPHFVSAGPSGSGTTSNIADKSGSTPGKVDVNSLNMNNPEDRAVYKEYMKSRGIRL